MTKLHNALYDKVSSDNVEQRTVIKLLFGCFDQVALLWGKPSFFPWPLSLVSQICVFCMISTVFIFKNLVPVNFICNSGQYHMCNMSVETFIEGFHDENSVCKMQYNILGRTNLHVSKLSVGGGPFGALYESFSESEGLEVVKFAIQQGINYVDTSPHYGLGRSEKFLGKALKDIPRTAFYIATKVGHYDTYCDYSACTVKKSLEKSLSLLKLSCVDIVLIHDIEFAPSLNVILSETIPALLEMKAEKKLRFIGASAYPVSVLKDLCELSEDIDVIVTYSRDTIFDNTFETYVPFFQSKNIGIINAGATGMGLLSTIGPQTWHPASARLKEICRKAVEEASAEGVELGKLAVFYSLQKTYIHSSLVGMVSMKILKANLDVAFNNISDKELQVLNRIKLRYFDGTNHHWELPNSNDYKEQVKKSDGYKYDNFLNF